MINDDFVRVFLCYNTYSVMHGIRRIYENPNMNLTQFEFISVDLRNSNYWSSGSNICGSNHILSKNGEYCIISKHTKPTVYKSNNLREVYKTLSHTEFDEDARLYDILDYSMCICKKLKVDNNICYNMVQNYINNNYDNIDIGSNMNVIMNYIEFGKVPKKFKEMVYNHIFYNYKGTRIKCYNADTVKKDFIKYFINKPEAIRIARKYFV